jgi:hypothetical protein
VDRVLDALVDELDGVIHRQQRQVKVKMVAQLLRCVQHRVMLHSCGNQVAAASGSLRRQRCAAQRKVVAFAAAAGKKNFIGAAVQAGCQLLARTVHGVLGLLAPAMD